MQVADYNHQIDMPRWKYIKNMVLDKEMTLKLRQPGERVGEYKRPMCYSLYIFRGWVYANQNSNLR